MFKSVEPNLNFPELEKKILNHWYRDGIIRKYLIKNRNKKSKLTKVFSFLDGPITANNPMGVHHAWGRTYKDLWQKFFNLLGYEERFQSGFDCQGLWVEVEVEKELGLKNKKEIENLVPGDPTSPKVSLEASKKASIAKFVSLCKERVEKFSKIQIEQSKRLGYFMDWNNSYYTMADENNYMIWLFLKKCFDNGWIYKGRESVPWCPRCETAISQHEILTEDYKEVAHESIYFELPIKGRKKEYLLVWTTTPWTIPANIAVAVDTDMDYSLIEGTTGDFFWVANKLIKKVFKGDYKKIVKTVKGKELIGLKYNGPFDNLPAVAEVSKKNPNNFHTVIATDQKILPISIEEGTGLVHTAVSAGTEDFKLGKKLGLPMIPVIADNADYLPKLGFLSGKNAKKNPRIIFDYLLEREKKHKENWVFEIHNYKHRYPACWRCKTELVWKVEDEWYIAMDKPSRCQKSKVPTSSRCAGLQGASKSQNFTLRQRMIEVAKKIKWIPDFGLERELDWLKNMHDWLISKKNRYWGLALPIFECKKCCSFEVIGSKEELKQKAVKGWQKFEGHSPHKPFIDEVFIKCFRCGDLIKRIDDVGNPWLDAGIVGYSTISNNNQGKPLYLESKEKWKKWFPASFITESFPGQFKNWFYSLIAMSTVMEDINPFQTVLGYATLTGEDGRPMHKSWGNAIEFNEGADKIGVDVMRWMYSRQNPTDNMLFGYKKADEVRRQFYLMLWNIYKFFVEYSNLDKFQISKSKIQTNSKLQNLKPKNVLDIWIVNRFFWLVNFVEKSLKEYNAKDAAWEIEKFVSDLSTWYIRRSRDRVWVNSENKQDKENFYRVLYYVLVNLSVILSPFIPFLSDEIYTNLTKEESVHLACWPKIKFSFDKKIISDMDLVKKIVEVGHQVRKDQMIKVRQPLSEIVITLPKSFRFLIKENNSPYMDLIKKELNVKLIQISTDSALESIKVSYDTELTEELIYEGKLRELVRKIQNYRKQNKIKPEENIDLVIPDEFIQSADFLKKKVLARKIKFGNELMIN